MTPVAATAAHQRWAEAQVPSEDQELADEAVQARQADRGERRDQEEGGRDRDDGRDAAVGRDLARVAALVEDADEEEERAGREAVVDHLEDRALERHRREGADSQDDEAEVRHRGVGHEPLHVVLGIGDEGAVDDADDAEDPEPGRVVHGRLGEERQGEAQEAVHAELQQDAGEDDRAGRRAPRCGRRAARCGAGRPGP